MLFCYACNSEEDCTKTIVVRPEFSIQSQFGNIFYPEITQEVPCDLPEPEVAESLQQLPKLTNFLYTITEFNFIPDTGNNTGYIQFKIELENLSNQVAKGFPYLTINTGGGFTSSSAFNGCAEIAANSSCTITFEEEYSLDLGIINTYDIINVEYLLIE